MKIVFFSASVALSLAAQTHASLLLSGIHDFDGARGISPIGELADENAAGFSGRVFENTNSISSGGDTSATYGLGGDPTASSDGYAIVTSFQDGFFFNVENTTSQNMALTTFLFDAAGVAFDLSYKIGAAPSVSLGTISPSASYPSVGSSAAFTEFASDLTGIQLSGFETISFNFQLSGPSGAFALDNIALVAVPETAGVASLGLLMIGGLTLRSRRRSVA